MTGLAAKVGLDIGTKVMAIAAGAGCLVLGGVLAFTVISKNSEIRTLKDAIHNPETGYVVRLAAAERDLTTCRTNRITLEEATRRQNKAVADARAESQARINSLTGQLETARAATANAQRRAAAILAARPTEDVCASADALILEQVP